VYYQQPEMYLANMKVSRGCTHDAPTVCLRCIEVLKTINQMSISRRLLGQKMENTCHGGRGQLASALSDWFPMYYFPRVRRRRFLSELLQPIKSLSINVGSEDSIVSCEEYPLFLPWNVFGLFGILVIYTYLYNGLRRTDIQNRP